MSALLQWNDLQKLVYGKRMERKTVRVVRKRNYFVISSRAPLEEGIQG